MITHFNRSKIIATIGPATMDPAILEKLIYAGVDVCRINGSHGEYDMMRSIIQNVRDLNQKLQTHVAILFDLQGPKIRIGDMKDGDFLLIEGEYLILTTNEVLGTREEVYIKYQNFHNDAKVGDRVLVDDGKLELEVSEILPNQRVKTKIIHGGILSSRKGVNLPNTEISLPSLTEKDKNSLSSPRGPLCDAWPHQRGGAAGLRSVGGGHGNGPGAGGAWRGWSWDSLWRLCT